MSPYRPISSKLLVFVWIVAMFDEFFQYYIFKSFAPLRTATWTLMDEDPAQTHSFQFQQEGKVITERPRATTSPPTRLNSTFPNLAASRKQAPSRQKMDINLQANNETAISAFSKLQLFVPTFPGGYEELRETLIRSLEFFWPLEQLNIMVVLDQSIYGSDKDRDNRTQEVYSFFQKGIPVTVAYNPHYRNMSGHDLGMYVSFWADNFTDAEYIGFLDDDTLFSMGVTDHDLFDERGRPRVLSKYPVGDIVDGWHHNWHRVSHWALGIPSFINAMAYFPTIIHRRHLQIVREAMLQHHPEFACFDDLFVEMVHRTKGYYCHFVIIFDYIWWHHREDYDWRFARDE